MGTAKTQTKAPAKKGPAQKGPAQKGPVGNSPARNGPARNSTAKKSPAKRQKRWRSRAVSRIIDAGNSAYCAECDLLIKFRARIRSEQIICNVYVANKWDRVEHYHSECYDTAGAPYGEPDKNS